jgi:hypothetical protein
MRNTLTDEQISQVLFETDPMGTCCKENDCFDEYDSIAGAIGERLENGQEIESAISETLIEWFSVDSVDPVTLACTVQALEASCRK